MKNFAAKALVPLLLPIALLTAWWVSSAESTSIYFPPLESIFQTFRDLWLFALVPEHVFPSLFAVILGLGISIVAGVAFGVLLGLNTSVSIAAGPALQFFRYLPAVALIPLAIQLVGLGLEMRVSIIVFGALWPILLNTIDGVRGIHPAIIDVARSNRVRLGDWIFRMVLPAASPQIFAGIRASLAVSVIVMVASEMLGATSGLGFFILQSQRQFSLPEMWSGMFLLGIIGYLLNVILLAIEHMVLSWHRLSRS